jgi:hypothetical protein
MKSQEEKMKDLSSNTKPKNNHSKMMIDWRRNKVLELSSQGNNQVDIASVLQINEPTVSRDLSYLKKQAKTNIKKYIDERLPEEYEKCLVGLNAILREAWTTSQKTDEAREKIQALSLAKECYSMKLDLLTNATVVEDAIRFVSSKSKENPNSNEDDKEESKEPDYDEDEDQIEEEQEEETAGEISITTTANQVFKISYSS